MHARTHTHTHAQTYYYKPIPTLLYHCLSSMSGICLSFFFLLFSFLVLFSTFPLSLFSFGVHHFPLLCLWFSLRPRHTSYSRYSTGVCSGPSLLLVDQCVSEAVIRPLAVLLWAGRWAGYPTRHLEPAWHGLKNTALAPARGKIRGLLFHSPHQQCSYLYGHAK